MATENPMEPRWDALTVLRDERNLIEQAIRDALWDGFPDDELQADKAEVALHTVACFLIARLPRPEGNVRCEACQGTGRGVSALPPAGSGESRVEVERLREALVEIRGDYGCYTLVPADPSLPPLDARTCRESTTGDYWCAACVASEALEAAVSSGPWTTEGGDDGRTRA